MFIYNLGEQNYFPDKEAAGVVKLTETSPQAVISDTDVSTYVDLYGRTSTQNADQNSMAAANEQILHNAFCNFFIN